MFHQEAFSSFAIVTPSYLGCPAAPRKGDDTRISCHCERSAAIYVSYARRPSIPVIPAKAGIQAPGGTVRVLDSGLRQNDGLIVALIGLLTSAWDAVPAALWAPGARLEPLTPVPSPLSA